MPGVLFNRVALAAALLGLAGAWRVSAEAEPGAGAGPPPVPVYTLEECLEIGLREASVMHNARRDRQIADRTIRQVRARALPQLSAQGSYTRRDELDTVEFGGQSLEIGSLDNYSVSLTLSQLLYAGGGVRAALDAARDYREWSDYDLFRRQAELQRDIRMQFVDILFLEAALAVARQTVELWRETLEQTQSRYRQDMAAEFDVLSARVQWANAQPDLIRSSNRLALAKAAFANRLNLPDDRYELRGELRYEPFDGALEMQIEEARQARPELHMARRGVAMREAEIAVEKSEYKPSLHLSTQYGAQPSVMDAGAAGRDLDFRWSATLQARWTWFDGGLRRARMQEKELERDKARENWADLRRHVDLEVRQAHLNVRQAAQEVQATRQSVELAEKTMEIASARYSTGLSTRLEMAEANTALSTARLNELEALRHHAHAVARMRFALGRDAEGGR